MSIERAASFPAGAFTLAVAQYGMAAERAANVTRALGMLEKAATQGADLLLLPELFEYPYFPITRGNDDYFKQATPLAEHPYLAEFQTCARKYRLALLSVFLNVQMGIITMCLHLSLNAALSVRRIVRYIFQRALVMKKTIISVLAYNLCRCCIRLLLLTPGGGYKKSSFQ